MPAIVPARPAPLLVLLLALVPFVACDSRGAGPLTRALALRAGQTFHALPPEAPVAGAVAPRRERRDARPGRAMRSAPAGVDSVPATPPVPRLLAVPPIDLLAGDTARLPVEVAIDRLVERREATWRSLDPNVARVDGGAIVGLRAGDATVLASVDGMTVPVEVRVRRALRGRVLDVDGRPVAGARVLVSGQVEAQLVSGDDGRFALAGTLPSASSVSLRVLPADGTSLFAASLAVDADDAGALGIVLVPARWRVRGGPRDGVTVDVRQAVARTSTTFARLQRSSELAGDRVVGWPVDRLPVAVAIGAGIGPAEAASFWAAARDLERDLGRALFTAAVPGTEAPITVRLSPGLHTPALTHTSWTGRGDVFDAELLVRDAGALRDRGIVGHELLHALGFSHGSAWPSLAAATGASSPGWLTDADVAWSQLLFRLREVQARERAQFGLGAATP